MDKRLLAIVIFACIAGFMVGCACQSTPDPEPQPSLAEAQTTATIELEGNITTGYAWVIHSITPDGVVKEIANDYIQDQNDEDLDGIGGTFTFTFEAIGPGEAQIDLFYVRDWEDESDPANAVFKATVDEAGNLKMERVD